MRNYLRVIAHDANEWCGVPMPLDDQPLVTEPSYPFDFSTLAKTDEELGVKVRNIFYSSKLRSQVAIYEEGGKVCITALAGGSSQATLLLNTLGASDAWGLDQELTACELLKSLITPRHFKQYMLTGSFLERSKRSGVFYLFRKLRPTLALRTVTGEDTRVLCALCMHPIAHYSTSWAGAMCPTDDVVAHLMLMRGDEPMYWRRCNQHPAHFREAGI